MFHTNMAFIVNTAVAVTAVVGIYYYKEHTFIKNGKIKINMNKEMLDEKVIKKREEKAKKGLERTQVKEYHI